ncbi:MAG: hypothetical protein ACI8TX_003305 [Hyphomicrobiaceae bacterium]|jgi:hypothetical protein
MKGWMRKLGLGALVLSLGFAVGGCDDGGGSGLIRIFFGIVGDGDCGRVVVTVDLDAAGASIDTDDLGAANCDLASSLDGCQSDIDLDGNLLTVTIDSCTIDEISALFSCVFDSGLNIDALEAATTAICECSVAGCDETPPLCIDRDPNPLSCENCDNDVDDDGNGLTDCEDPVCENVAPCNFNSTTTSTTTTVSDTTTTLPPVTTTIPPTTTTSSSTTTSVTLPPAVQCNVVFRVEDAALFGSLQFDIDYADAPGGFAGMGADVECAFLVSQSVPSANDKESLQILTVGVISIAGIQGPADIVECTFNGAICPVADDFDITITDATDPDGNEFGFTPSVIPSQINVVGTTSTTLEPTTTTLDGGTTTTTNVAPTTTSSTTTTTEASGPVSEIVFSVSNALTFGALQFGVDYSGAAGTFVDIDGDVDCTDSIGGSVLPVFNDITGDSLLNVGYIALFGFDGPTEIARCRFNGTPSAGDFGVVIDDAGDPDGNGFDFNTIDVTVAVVPL